MSLEQDKDYICNNIIDEEEDNKYFIMIYKPNINKKEKKGRRKEARYKEKKPKRNNK